MSTGTRQSTSCLTFSGPLSALLIVNVCLATTALAQEWAPTAGPPSGEIMSSLELADGRLFAGSSGKGLFLRENPGEPWQRIDSPSFDGSVQIRDLVAYDTLLVAGTAGQGVFKSADRGLTWTSFNDGLTNGLVFDLLVSRTGLLYAATTGGLFEYGEGDEWIPRTESIGGGSIRTVAENSLGHLFIGEFTEGVFRSHDRGLNWELASAGLTVTTIRSLAVGPNNELYAGTWGGSVVHRSLDAGDTWEVANSGLETIGVWSVRSDATGRLYAGSRAQGIFVSDDRGDSWRRADAPETAVTRIELGPGGSVWASSRVGILESSDGGVTWTTAGVPFSTVEDLIFTDGRLIAGTDLAGLFYSDDEGQTWSPTVIDAEQIFNIQEGRDGTILATTWQGRVYRSENRGEDWEEIWKEFLFPFTATSTSDGTVYVGTNAGIVRIDVAGNPTRTAIPDTRVRHLVAGADDVLFAATEGEAIYRSRDLGETWEQTGLEVGIPGETIWRVAVSSDRESTGRVAAAPYESGGVWISDDGGDSWWPSDDIQGYYVQDLTIGPANQIVAGTFRGWVLELSPDSVWWRVIKPRFDITPIWSIATGPDGTAYVGGNPVGVYLMRMAVSTSASTDRDELPELRVSDRFELYPNPVNDEVSLVLDAAKPHPEVIEVFDSAGRLVLASRTRGGDAATTERLNVAGLPSGQYFVRLRNEATGEVSRVRALSVHR